MKINLSEAQLKKILSGKSVQIANCDIGCGDCDIGDMELKHLKKVHKAGISGKGIRLNGGMLEGCGILSSLKKLGRRVGLSNGDMRAIGSFARPLLNKTSKAVSNVASRAVDVGENQAMMGLAGAGVNPYMPKLDGGAFNLKKKINRFISKDLGLSKKDVRNIGRKTGLTKRAYSELDKAKKKALTKGTTSYPKNENADLLDMNDNMDENTNYNMDENMNYNVDENYTGGSFKSRGKGLRGGSFKGGSFRGGSFKSKGGSLTKSSGLYDDNNDRLRTNQQAFAPPVALTYKRYG